MIGKIIPEEIEIYIYVCKFQIISNLKKNKNKIKLNENERRTNNLFINL